MRPLSVPGLPGFSGSTTLTAHTLGANLEKTEHIKQKVVTTWQRLASSCMKSRNGVKVSKMFL